jgi:predicted ATPase
MIDFIDDIVAGRWFKSPSPFRCVVQKAHPKLCVITGPNTSGKSLLRKVIHNRYADRKWHYINLSQEGRCNSNGGLRLFVYGTETDESTGYNSVKMFLKMIQSGQSYENPFGVMLDEPEIGCSEEVQVAIGQRIVRDLDTMPNLHGLYIVTHSRELVRSLLPLNPTHWRLSEDGMTLEQFVNRTVAPVDLEELLAVGKERWHAVHQVIKEGKKGGM